MIRVWDRINLHWFGGMSRIVEMMPSARFPNSFESILDLSRFVIQKSSGLLDIENKEIYEGDIVELHLAANDKSRIPDSRGICEVYFDRAAFRMREIKRNWFLKVYNGALLGDFNVCKIIGNVFENPELLKV